MKIAVNRIYGGFALSQIALHQLSELKGQKYDNDNIYIIKRDDMDLITVIENLGQNANGDGSDWDKSEIKIIEVSDNSKWEIINDDGRESVREVVNSIKAIRTLRHIEIVLENFEVIKVFPQNIAFLRLDGLRKSISYRCESLFENIKADEVVIMLRKEVNTLSSYFDGHVLNTNRMLPFDRLKKCSDITAIEVVYNDDNKEYIYVNFKDDKNENNLYQKTIVNELSGDLVIEIIPTDINIVAPKIQYNPK